MESPQKSKTSAWIEAIRLRTLPLSIAGIVAGAALAYRLNAFKMKIFIPAICTTLLLQILSNLANDYGDAQKGTDGEHRIGPQRMVQSGLLPAKDMKLAIILTAGLALISGVYLLRAAFDSEMFLYALSFFVLGLISIWAAVKYTVGQKAYGYKGLGDVFVMLFFGFVSVAGSFFLYTGQLSISALLQSLAIGSFSTGVLHLNNMRDRESDAESGKMTIAVKLGAEKSKKYFYLLMSLGLIGVGTDLALTALHVTELLTLFIVFPILLLTIKVHQVKELKEFNTLLKPLALSTFFYSLLLFTSFAL